MWYRSIRKRSDMTLRLFLCSLLLAGTLQPAPDSKSSPYFDFHNNFWMNLHHTLYSEAALQWRPARPSDKIITLPMPTSGFTDEEKQAWNQAVQFYVTTFAHRRLLLDDELVKINNDLATCKDTTEVCTGSDIPASLSKLLSAAAPVYRTKWWPPEQKANQEWIATMRPRVDEMAPSVIPRLEQLLQDKWPDAPDQVDVVKSVSEVGGAYTTLDPGHTTISRQFNSSSDDSLETVFHEGAHLLTTHLREALAGECQAQKKDCADLWHAVQFYTVGEVVKAELAKRRKPNYTPYAYKFGLYDRGHWPGFRQALEKDWQPYIEGKTNFPAAIHKLVTDAVPAK